MSLTLFGVPSSQAGIPLWCPTQSFNYGGGLVSVQGLDCHLGLNRFYILCNGQIIVIFNTWVRKMIGFVSPNIFQVRPNLLSYEAVPSEAPYYHILSRVQVLLQQRVHFGTHYSIFFACVSTLMLRLLCYQWQVLLATLIHSIGSLAQVHGRGHWRPPRKWWWTDK